MHLEVYVTFLVYIFILPFSPYILYRFKCFPTRIMFLSYISTFTHLHLNIKTFCLICTIECAEHSCIQWYHFGCRYFIWLMILRKPEINRKHSLFFLARSLSLGFIIKCHWHVSSTCLCMLIHVSQVNDTNYYSAILFIISFNNFFFFARHENLFILTGFLCRFESKPILANVNTIELRAESQA